MDKLCCTRRGAGWLWTKLASKETVFKTTETNYSFAFAQQHSQPWGRNNYEFIFISKEYQADWL